MDEVKRRRCGAVFEALSGGADSSNTSGRIVARRQRHDLSTTSWPRRRSQRRTVARMRPGHLRTGFRHAD